MIFAGASRVLTARFGMVRVFRPNKLRKKHSKPTYFPKVNPTKKIHDLGALLEQCQTHDPTFETLREQVLPLVDYYLQTRHPDIGDFMDYSEIKSTQAHRDASSIVKFVSKKLSL